MSQNLFRQRLENGDILIADGATGTNLLSRGLPRGATPETWVLENPEEIVALHRQFIAAGSDIILTSTFGGSSLRLADGKLAGRAAEINQRAVELARQAAALEGKPVLVAGSIGPAGKLMKPYGPLSPEEAQASFGEQALLLAEAGVDLLVVETHFDIGEASAAVQAAHSVSTLPVVCSFSYDRGVRTMMGVKAAQMADQIARLEVDALGINCGRSLDENEAVLKELHQAIELQATGLPVWFKPNAGMPQVDELGNTTYRVTPEEMGARVKGWLEAGARIVGGCCGTTPQHLEVIAQSARSSV